MEIICVQGVFVGTSHKPYKSIHGPLAHLDLLASLASFITCLHDVHLRHKFQHLAHTTLLQGGWGGEGVGTGAAQLSCVRATSGWPANPAACLSSLPPPPCLTSLACMHTLTHMHTSHAARACTC